MVNDNISTNGLNDSAGMNGAHDMNDNNNNALNENSDSRPPSLPAFASPDILRLPTAAFNVRNNQPTPHQITTAFSRRLLGLNGP